MVVLVLANIIDYVSRLIGGAVSASLAKSGWDLGKSPLSNGKDEINLSVPRQPVNSNTPQNIITNPIVADPNKNFNDLLSLTTNYISTQNKNKNIIFDTALSIEDAINKIQLIINSNPKEEKKDNEFYCLFQDASNYYFLSYSSGESKVRLINPNGVDIADKFKDRFNKMNYEAIFNSSNKPVYNPGNVDKAPAFLYSSLIAIMSKQTSLPSFSDGAKVQKLYENALKSIGNDKSTSIGIVN